MMRSNWLKSMAAWGVSKGMDLPHAKLDRVGELVFLRRLLLQLQVDCVLDVGANIGQFASELRAIGYHGHIVSFEPVAAVFGTLQAHFANDAKWKGFNLALGSRDDTLSISVPRLTVLSSLLEPRDAEPGTRAETVAVRRLSDLLPHIRADLGVQRIFLKMDTQGYDLEVFKGASACVEQLCGIQSELSVRPLYNGMPHYIESLQTYEAAGFDLYNLSVVNRIDGGGLLELNCLMQRRP